VRLGVAWLVVSLLWSLPREGWSRPQRTTTQESAIASCDDLDPSSLIVAIERELASLRAQPLAKRVDLGRVQLSNQDYLDRLLLPIQTAARQGKRALCQLLSRRIKLQPLTRRPGQVTAYYHPVIRGSRRQQGPYQVPLFRRPSEESLASQPTEAILTGALAGHGLELVYVESLAIALHVHIEGSATVALDDGTEVNLTTDGHNGHPYQNPLRLLRGDHRIPDDFPTAPGQSKTQAFITAHPEVLREYWNKNPHFVFFKETPLRGTGKFGELVAGRSVAVDPRHVPMGALLLLRTQVATQAASSTLAGKSIARLVLAQDTGAAIVGPGRVDLFVGSGEEARVAAAHTSYPGELFLLLPRRSRR
jgi:membrane-bound lytic murein transglycosylase